MNFTTQDIGTISHGVDGSDQYLILTCVDEDCTPQQAIDWLLPQVYREPSHAGAYFCRHVSATPMPYRDDQVIAIIHHQYDV
jgi:hypothetical protein